ncbi:hypothetical protein [Burkholderia sp. THE68]|uniref:hypothetical protein n=1 Tax=Burkholderia sp. THE68 TaxID=758782 RepID=UPI001E3BD8E5|nr:hypothetical protein [Burkholderia sp. THE68]
MNFALGITLNQQRFSGQFSREVVAVAGNLADVADANPRASKDASTFELGEVNRAIKRAGHAVRRTLLRSRQG